MNTTGWVKQEATGLSEVLVKISGDGKIILTTDRETIQIKENGTITDITPSGFVDYFYAIAINDDGNRIIFVSNEEDLYLSTNKGTSWTVSTNYKGGNTGTYIADIAISDSGQYVLLADRDNSCAYLSSDYGSTWETITSDITLQNGVRMSIDGSVMYIAGYGDTTPLHAVAVSRDYGATWSYIGTSVFSDYFATNFIDCSTDGQVVYISAGTALSYGDETFAVSDDYGSTWEFIDFRAIDVEVTAGAHISCSGDGNKVLVTGGISFGTTTLNVAILYYSEDKGVSWTAFDFDEHLWRTDISDNGSIMVAANRDGYDDGTPIVGHIWTYSSIPVDYDFYPNYTVLHLNEAKCVRVLGYPWFDNVQTWRYVDTTTGATPNSITIDNATLVSADIAADVLAKTAEYYKLRYQQDVTLFPDAAIKPGDIRTVSSLYGKSVDGITEKLEGDLTGGYLTATKFVGRERMSS